MDCTYLSLQLNLGYAIAFLIFLQRCQDRLDHARFLQITRILANRTKEFIISRAHTFIHTFIIWYKFTIKHCVYLNISEWYFARFSIISFASKNWWDSMCPEFITAPVNIQLSNAVSISRHRSPALYPALTCTEHSRTVSFKSSSLAIRAINDCLIDNHGHLARLYSSNDSKLSQRCSHARNSSRVFNWAACAMRSRSVRFILKCTVFHSH